MGQYYKAIAPQRKEYVNPFSFAKLMESAWLKNDFVLAVERLLSAGNDWYKTALVWGGDYADEGLFITDKEKKLYKDWYEKHEPERAEKYPKNLVPSLYDMCMGDQTKYSQYYKDELPLWTFRERKPASLDFTEAYKAARFIVNHTKKEFVDKRKVPSIGGWRVHPLPLLTSSGNGRGGGDYHPIDDSDGKFVGSWAGDVISVEPVKPEGFTEIRPNFREE